jgi:general secretion pathway protein G
MSARAARAGRSTARPTTPGNGGFTLVEILIVVTILGILVTMAQPRVISAVQHAREAVLKQDLVVLRDALDQHYADTGRYPASLEDLVEKKYIRKVPVDPMTGRADSWVLIFVDPDAEDGAPSGIFDVRSGSEKVALGGAPYAEW